MRLAPPAAALAAALVIAGAARAADTELSWSTNPGAAFKEAAAQRKPVLMDIGAVWCVPCRQMDEHTYPDPAVRAQAGAFVLLKIDADVQTTILQRYDVSVFPTLLFLDGKGGEIGRIKGFTAPAALAPRMKAVSRGYARYLAARSGKGDPEFVGDYLTAAGNPKDAATAYKRAVKDRGGDAAKREACEMKLAAAEGDAGEKRDAARIYERLSNEASDPTRRGAALEALVQTQLAMGKRKDAEASFARLSKEFPDLAAAIGDPEAAKTER